MAKVMTDFDPKKHGFHFGNEFVNAVLETPFGNITTRGRCGGMAFAALDYYYAKLPIPTHRGSDFPDGKVPADHTRLADYIYGRLMDSFLQNGEKFLSWTMKLDHGTWLYGDGVTKLTKEEEFPKLLRQLASGPVALGLITAEHLWDIGNNHQVVAYGAELDEATGAMTVHIYDNNAPDQVVTLTSDPYDPHFTSSLIDADGNHFWYRGWFVEDYTPQRPTYIDLAVSRGLSLSDPYLDLGEPLDCTYTIRNFGDYPCTIQSLNVDVTAPVGEPSTPKFAPNAIVGPIQPQSEHLFSGHNDCFAGSKGRYTLKVSCTQQPGIVIDLPTSFVLAAANVFVPTREVVVDVEYFSQAITAPPPFVESVQAVVVTDGATEPFKPCEKPRTKYRASWVYGGSEGTRELEVFSEPIKPGPNKNLVFIVKFATLAAMRQETVKLALAGRASDGSNINVVVPLTGNKDVFTGTWKLQHQGSANYTLALTIEGADDLPRYLRRSPRGDVLDSHPQTVATVDLASAGYPFRNYEPGADRNCAIEMAPKRTAMAPDGLEQNDSFEVASMVDLKGAASDPAKAILEGVWKHFGNLNFHCSSDQDCFLVKYESLPGDDQCELDAPETVRVSEYLGLSMTRYPPSLSIVVNATGSCVDFDVYRAEPPSPQLDSSLAKVDAFFLYSPTRRFSNKQLYAMLKNSSFVYQGALAYAVDFGYMPMHVVMSVNTNAPAYRARPDIRRRLLGRYFSMIDLPRPGDDLVSKASDPSFPYPADSIVITDQDKCLANNYAFLAHPDTVADLKAIAPTQAQAVLASAMATFGRIAQRRGLNQRAEEFYQASAAGFSAALLPREQVEVLQELASFYEENNLPAKSAEVKRRISDIQSR